MARALRKFIAMTAGQKWLLTEAVFFLFLAKGLLLILHFKTAMKISMWQENKDKEPEPGLLNEIKRALHNADRLSFWKNRCLVKCLAGRWMLQRREIPSQLSFGVRIDEEKKLVAHAWLKAGDFEVVEKNDFYHELYLF